MFKIILDLTNDDYFSDYVVRKNCCVINDINNTTNNKHIEIPMTKITDRIFISDVINDVINLHNVLYVSSLLLVNNTCKDTTGCNHSITLKYSNQHTTIEWSRISPRSSRLYNDTFTILPTIIKYTLYGKLINLCIKTIIDNKDNKNIYNGQLRKLYLMFPEELRNMIFNYEYYSIAWDKSQIPITVFDQSM